MMTPERAEKHLKLLALAGEVMDREDVPEDLRFRAAQILNLHEKLTHYIEPVSDFCEEVWQEVE